MYKINLHAHTIFSDGSNTPYVMALKAKELGFTSLVITDHLYTNIGGAASLNSERFNMLKRAKGEAKRILPVIIGVELAFGNEEMLVFGSAMINEIMTFRESGTEITMDHLLNWKHKHDSAFILCHPINPVNWPNLRPILDGYERINSAQDMFKDDRELDALEGLPSWCNSDAHHNKSLSFGYNLVDTKIETETDLIQYIKSGKQPEHYYVDEPERCRAFE